jgi:DNA-binding NarL/FixJ family response regulator
MGAEAFAERARRELVVTGEKVRKRSEDHTTDLTAQEERIAELARQRHTNPEIGAELFPSARTVEWHLRNIVTKLGISSRRELDAALTRRSRARCPSTPATRRLASRETSRGCHGAEHVLGTR